MEKKQKQRPGPKRIVREETVADFFIRDFPVRVRAAAKARAASQGVTLREFTIRALEIHANSVE